MDEINYYLKENNLNKGDGKEYVAVVEQSLRGVPVHTDLFRTGISIKGGFRDIKDRFDRERHRVLLNMNSALPVQRIMDNESEVKISLPRKSGAIVYDVTNLELGKYRLIMTVEDKSAYYHISPDRPVEIVEDEGDF